MTLGVYLRDRGLYRKFLAICAQASEGPQFAHRALCDVCLAKIADVLAMRFAYAGRDKTVERMPQHFLCWTAKHLFCCRIEKYDALVFIHRNNGIHRGS